jgi:hypothetical protein
VRKNRKGIAEYCPLTVLLKDTNEKDLKCPTQKRPETSHFYNQ